MKDVHISVVVLTNDRPQLLAKALRSLAGQSRKPFETVIVVDSRKRGTETDDAIRRFAPKPYRVVSNTGHSLTYGRRAGIRAARGTVVAHLDDDCELPPNHIETVTGHFRNNPSLSAVYGRIVNAAPKNPYARTQYAYYERGLMEYFASFRKAVAIPSGRILDDELLAAKRKDLLAFGYPDQPFRWYRNSDVDLGFWFERHGKTALFDPRLTARAYPRQNLRDLLIAAWTNGYSDAHTVRRSGKRLDTPPFPSRFVPWWRETVGAYPRGNPLETVRFALLLLLFPAVTRTAGVWYRLTRYV